MTQGLPGLARQGLEDADRRRRQVNRAGASLPVGEMNLGRVEIDMLPAQGQDFVFCGKPVSMSRRIVATAPVDTRLPLPETSSSTCPSRVNSALASATATSILGLRASILASQGSFVSPRRTAELMTAMAPMIKR